MIDEGNREALRIECGKSIPSARVVRVMEQLVEVYGKPNQNAFVERFNRTFRNEVLDAHLFNRLGDVQRIVDEWLTDYNEYRPHESLGDVPPAEFMPRSFKPEVSEFELST